MLHTASHLTLGAPRFSTPVGQPDTDSILVAWTRAFARDGVTAPASVQGDFAVGLTLADGRSFLAVDRFGVQTLCYRVDSQGRLRFAARADELADEHTPVDPQAIFDYLFFHAIPSPRTVYQGIYRLPPGHCASFEAGKLSIRPYWTATFDEQRNPSFETCKAQFRELLQQAVAARLDGSKAACFLSGGTDSSTVAGMVAQAGGGRAATYSIGFDAQGYDEMEFARLAARHFQTDHHEYYVTPADLVRSVPEVAAYCDQPFGNSSLLPAYYCARMARDDGVTRLLAGDGGDELFGGNARYAKQRIFGWYGRVPDALRNMLIEPVLGMPGASAFPLTRKAGSYVEQARVPMPDRLQMYNLITRLGVAEVLTPAMLAAVNLDAPLQLQRAVWAAPAPCSHLNRELAFDWRFTLAESDLPKVRQAVGCAGIDVAFPMLDDGLLDFSLRLPTDYKLRKLRLRWFFKEALRGFLPDEIIAKKKQGFGLPFGVWANTDPALQALARDSLQGLAARGVVRVDFVDALMRHKLPEHPGYFGEMVWILMMLEQWLAAKAPGFRIA